MEKVGGEGVITVEESKTTETVLEDPSLRLTDRKINFLKDMIPLLEQIAKSGSPLLILAEDIEGEALATLVVNQIRGELRSAAVSEEVGLKLENVQLAEFGRACRFFDAPSRRQPGRSPRTRP